MRKLAALSFVFLFAACGDGTDTGSGNTRTSTDAGSARTNNPRPPAPGTGMAADAGDAAGPTGPKVGVDLGNGCQPLMPSGDAAVAGESCPEWTASGFCSEDGRTALTCGTDDDPEGVPLSYVKTCDCDHCGVVEGLAFRLCVSGDRVLEADCSPRYGQGDEEGRICVP